MIKVSKNVLKEFKKKLCLCYLDKSDKQQGVIFTTKETVKKYLKDGKLGLDKIKDYEREDDVTEKELKMGPYFIDNDVTDVISGSTCIQCVKEGKKVEAYKNSRKSDDEKLIDLADKLCVGDGDSFYMTNIELNKAMIEGDLDGSVLEGDNGSLAPILKHLDVMNK